SYQVVIGPRLSLLRLARQNQVYGTANAVDVADIIDGKLTNSFSNASTTQGHGLTFRYEKRLSGAYVNRSNVVQFDESDLDFLSRTCEHYGVFFFFEQDDNNSENIVFGDANVAFDNSSKTLPFRMTRGAANDASVSSFVGTSRPIPKRVFVHDFDDTQASTTLL